MRLRLCIISLITVVMATVSLFVSATSFDCNKASTYAELQICSSAELQLQDEQLNSAYVQAIERAADRPALRLQQRNWLRQRDKCATPECVASAMALRSQVLKDSLGVPPTGQLPVVKSVNTEPSQGASRPGGAKNVTHPAPPPAKDADDPHAWRPLKIALLVMGGVLLICIWLHSRGSMVIYSCYTDALWTTMTPFLAAATYFTAKSWLELSGETALISAVVVAALMALQIVIQTYRCNGFSLYFLLALYAKLVLLSLYFLSMAVLVLGGARTASDRRRRRNWALGGSVLFALLTGWMCRTRQFSHIDDYIAGRT